MVVDEQKPTWFLWVVAALTVAWGLIGSVTICLTAFAPPAGNFEIARRVVVSLAWLFTCGSGVHLMWQLLPSSRKKRGPAP